MTEADEMLRRQGIGLLPIAHSMVSRSIEIPFDEHPEIDAQRALVRPSNKSLR
jgi:hypothetical protein